MLFMRIGQTKTQHLLYLIVALCIAITLTPAAAQSARIPWAAWETLDSSTIGDDHTGSRVMAGSDITTPEGRATLMVTPGGTAEETKLAIPFKGADLADWQPYANFELQVYLPESNTTHPNRFFLGMADVTGGQFEWVAGVFSGTAAQPGWNTIAYPLDSAMRDLAADHDYNLYFSFYYDQGQKIPLTEPFYLGAFHLVADQTADDIYQQEAAALMGIDDAQFVDAVARETFDFFWFEANPQNGLVKDRSTPDSVSSIASTGFALAAIPIGIERGWISHDEGYARALTTLQTFASGGVQGEHGFFFHFVSMESGERVWNSEVSPIDTTLLVAGALTAGQYFAGTEVEMLADQLYAAIEWDWMLGGGDMLKMGWNPESGFIRASWDHFDESLLMYVLAIGSPTHPIPAASWDLWYRPVRVKGGYIYLSGEPLFVYQYPLAYLNLKNMEDYYANYWNNTSLACARNHQYVVDNRDDYATYEDGVWGLSASDGPFGYRAYGASEANQDGTIAPYAAAACLPFTPEIALEGMRAIVDKYGALAWREYGFVSAINEAEDWYSRAHIGIDQGDILLMLANSQDSLVWNLFMANPHIQNALDAMGFVASAGDYAVTPAYMAQVTGE
jgi:hypothetical protein